METRDVNAKELVEYIVRSLVDTPDKVAVEVVEGAGSTVLELKVVDQDFGKVIGKHGRIAQAIRTILTAATTRSGRRVILDILDR
jgi:hypothetical protein